jgi:MFS family permease
MLGTTLVVLSYSLLNPVLAVRLQTSGASSTAIGLIAMLPFVSIVLLVPAVPRLFARIGVGQAYRLGLTLELIASLGYLVTDDYRIWCVLGLMSGIGAAAAWNATEALIAHNVPATHRGRLTGLYQTALGCAMALGPLMPAAFNLTPMTAMALSALGLAGGVALTASPDINRLSATHDDHVPMGLLAAWRFRPALGWAAVVGGVFEVGLGSITTAYGSQIGLNLAKATSIAGAMGIGSFLLQYPVGWLADHWPPRRLFVAGGLMLLISGAAFMQASHWPWLIWICAATWGAVGGAMYTLSMIRVAHDFADSSALAGTSAMIASYTLGGAIGPIVSGWMLDHTGIQGQGLWLAALSISLIAAHAMWTAPAHHTSINERDGL